MHAASGLKPFEVLRFPGKHSNGTLSVAIASGAVVSSGGDGTTRIWDAQTGRETRRFTGPDFRFRSIVFAPDGRHVLTSAEETAVRYWTLDGSETRDFGNTAAFARSAALSADGTLAAAAIGETVHVWDVAGKSAYDLPAKSKVVTAAFAAPGHDVLSIETGGRLCRWPENGEPVCFSTGAGEVSRAAFSADGCFALIGTRFGGLQFWRLADQSPIDGFDELGAVAVSLALSSDGRRALVGCADKTLRLWNMRTGRQVSETRGTGSYISSVAFSPDDSYAVFGSDDGEVALWRLR